MSFTNMWHLNSRALLIISDASYKINLRLEKSTLGKLLGISGVSKAIIKKGLFSITSFLEATVIDGKILLITIAPPKPGTVVWMHLGGPTS